MIKEQSKEDKAINEVIQYLLDGMVALQESNNELREKIEELKWEISCLKRR